jgi:dihydroorotate dehydrogenase
VRLSENNDIRNRREALAMIDLYQDILRPLLFRLDAEDAHHFALNCLRLANNPILSRVLKELCDNPDPRLNVTIAGLSFANPIGLAAGLDKEGVALAGLAALGFGAIEVGTVTADAQAGNPRPRIFRLPQDKALINRMGFPSSGAYQLAHRLEQMLPLAKHLKAKIGINIGKTKSADIDRAADDYLRSFETLKSFGDYFAINISSPNTPELRKLQEPERLQQLISAIRGAGLNGKPLFVKIAPDLTDVQLNEIVDVLLRNSVDGIIATNTTFSREGINTIIEQVGGLSGAPLKAKALHVVARLYQHTQGRLPIIGVGGISSEQDVWRMMEAGAIAVQIYTSFVYEGPFLVRRILRGLSLRMDQENLNSIQAIVGQKKEVLLQGESANI